MYVSLSENGPLKETPSVTTLEACEQLKVIEISVGIHIARVFALDNAKLHIYKHGARKGHALSRWIRNRTPFRLN